LNDRASSFGGLFLLGYFSTTLTYPTWNCPWSNFPLAFH